MGLITIIIGSFKEYIILNTIIIIHELGHFMTAKILGINVKYIYIYPLGGISKFNMLLNDYIWKELLILLAGPLTQNIAYIILINIFNRDREVILIYHLSILIFNLLPIYPLDGGRIVNLLFNIFIPYKKSLQLIIKISYITTLIIFIIQKNITINIIVMLLFLLILIHKEENKINFIYNKFLLERVMNNYNFKRRKMINNITNFYRNRTHLIKENGKYYEEKEYLTKKYHGI